VDPPDIPLIPKLAAGGILRTAGSVLVGERAPEVLSLPRAARVDPLPFGLEPWEISGGSREIVTKVYLDRRQIAEAVGEVASDRGARR
jgi:hypothetical protein